ncbi:hypothetical protein N1F78_00290 [Seonamhaeicola sp. MEBiC1930]|uniref:hypothetical protein n=1 Tax=Seonamhaeicola sp. MEBiC01930 TaxID=2976768 RepID=UPI00324689F1
MFRVVLSKFKGSLALTVAVFLLTFFFFDFLINSALLTGLNKYYGLREKSEIALIGHSHLMLGVDKIQLEKELNVNVAKYTREGVNVSDRKLMIEQLLEENQGIETIIYGVDAWSFSGEGLSKNSFKLFYPFMDNNKIDSYIYKKTDLGDYLTKKFIKTSRFNEQLLGGSIRGFLGKWDNLKFGTIDLQRLEKQIEQNTYRKINNGPENIKIFKESMILLSEKKINVILLYLPTIDILSDVQETKYQETIEIINEVSNNLDNVTFLSFQEPWSHNYSIFYDPIHLNPKGQKLITKELINYIQKH